MAKIQTGLGKGLSALIADANEIQRNAHRSASELEQKRAADDNGQLLTASLEIPLDKIAPNPYQPRTEFNEEAIADLAGSIKLLGVIQPITVRPIDDGKYQIISGERRFRASKIAGLASIPAYIKKTDDRGMLELAIVENIQREDLDSIEVALSFQRLIDECNLTQEEMADRVGKKRATVTNYLRLLRLPAEIQFAIRAGRISMGHAKALLGIESPRMQVKYANQIIEQDLSVRQIEAKIKRLNDKRDKPANINELPDKYFRAIELVGKYFNNNVSIKRGTKGNGSMTIRFKNDSEIERFIEALEKINR